MKINVSAGLPVKCYLFIVALITLSETVHAAEANSDRVPPGFYRLPDGRIMANTPATAVAPPGYYLRRNGQLIKIDSDADANISTEPQVDVAPSDIPVGFHREADGRIVADDISNVTIPEGFHMMPDGALMSNTGMGKNALQHGKGMWMFDYRFSRMYMKDLLDTTNKVTASQAIATDGKYKFGMAPVDMTMDMHMFMIMHNITDNIMPMVMLHYMTNDMTMISSDGTYSKMKSSGIGDTVFSAMIQSAYSLEFNLGVSVPTGSINVHGPMQHNATTIQDNVKYPYGMQLGSGSYELKLGVGYKKFAEIFGWGGNYEYTKRLNRNKYDYKLGDAMLLDGWLHWSMTSFAAVRGKLLFRAVDQIDGMDVVIDSNKNMSPDMNTTSYGGYQFDAGASVIFKIPTPMLTLTIDFIKPVYQNLWGPQMATEWTTSANLSWMIH